MSVQARRAQPPVSFWTVYLGLASVGLLAGLICAGVPPLADLLRESLKLKLEPNPAGELNPLWIFVHNFLIIIGPLTAAAVFRPHQSRAALYFWGVFVCAVALLNVALIAGAIAAYGTDLLPYLPHLPLEYFALCLSLHCFWQATKRPLERSEIWGRAGAIAVVLVIGALIETYLTPTV